MVLFCLRNLVVFFLEAPFGDKILFFDRLERLWMDLSLTIEAKLTDFFDL